MKSAITFLILAVLLAGPSQFTVQYKLQKSFAANDVDHFSVDQFKNVYLVKGNELVKLDKEGEELYSYSNPIWGDIYNVDARNALNPYVFYRDVNQLVIVDNRLNASTALNFTDYGFLDVRFISFSDQNNVWFYDQATDKIYRFNMQRNKVSNSSLNITQISGSENMPADMVSTIDQVFLNVPDKGIFMFDAVGAFQKLLPIKGVTAFDVRKKKLLAVQDTMAIMYDLPTAQLSKVQLSTAGIKSLKKENQQLFVLKESVLEVYTSD
jgi:streptogramin lyase